MTAAQKFAAWSSRLSFDELPAVVRTAAKLHCLDALGCALAAHRLQAAAAVSSVTAESGGRTEASAIGIAERLPAPSAALVNGVLAHALDFDDTHGDAVCHVSAVVTPAALAVAEAVTANGRDVVAALTAGNEVTIRLGMAASSSFHRRGFHPTSVCGVFGAVTAAARLAGLDAGRTAQALGIAGSLASGLFEYLADGSETKPLHAGWAAQAGILAARLAALGATGPASVFEGRFGLFAAFADVHDIGLAVGLDDLGRRWETPRIAFKPYPACHYIHAPVDAAVRALDGRTVGAADVREILVRVPEPAVRLVLEPASEKSRPRTAYDAKFSLPFTLAARLVHGRVDLATFADEAIRDPGVLALAAKVRYAVTEFSTHPRAFPGAARVTLADGSSVEAEIPHQRGGPENPMTAAEVREKFLANACGALGKAPADALWTRMVAFEEQTDVAGVLAPLRETAGHPTR